MNRRSPPARSLCLLSALQLLLLSPTSAVAQGNGTGSATSSYLPSGGIGGFVPYTPGAGQGLGVMARAGVTRGNDPRGSMVMAGQRPSLGVSRGYLTPLAPIGTMSPMGTGQGRTPGILIRTMPSGGVMGGMSRPPVGGYPFRVPPSLLGPAASSPGMSM
jgi:hypothetical protein